MSTEKDQNVNKFTPSVKETRKRGCRICPCPPLFRLVSLHTKCNWGSVSLHLWIKVPALQSLHVTTTAAPPAGHLGCSRNRSRYSDMASQFRHRKAKITTRSNVESVRLRVFISGTTQFATVETNTRSTAITASSTLMSLPSKVRAVAFSKPSNWTTCCCCCWSSILEMRVWQASSASYRKGTRKVLWVQLPCHNLWPTPHLKSFISNGD